MKAARFWMSALAATAAGWTGAAFQMHAAAMAERAAEAVLFLIPRGAAEEGRRGGLAEIVAGYPEVASARWISPDDFVPEPASTASGPAAGPDRPWALEVRFRRPLAGRNEAAARVEALRRDTDWRYAIREDAVPGEAVRSIRRAAVLALLAFAVFSAMLAGGLRELPPSGGGDASLPAGALAGSAAVFAGSAAAAAAGWPASPATIGAGAAAAFLLAAVSAAVLQIRPVKAPESGQGEGPKS